MNIQTSDIEDEIYKKMVNEGPISVYASSHLKDPKNHSFSTVHRYFKKWENEKNIIIYKKEKHPSGNSKKLYGPTVLGLWSFYFSENGTPDKEFDSVFDKWVKEKKFFDTAIGAYSFDYNEYQKNPNQFKKFFKKQIKLYSLAFLEYEKGIPIEMQINVGMEILVKKDPESFLNMAQDLYNNHQGFRNDIDQYYENLFVLCGILKNIKNSFYKSS